MAEEHPLRPFYTVLVLAFGCSLLVASAAIGLRPQQDANRLLDQKRNILRAAGVYDAGVPVDEQFGAVQTRLVDLQSGAYLADKQIDPNSYDQQAALLSPEMSRKLSSEENIAGLRGLENYAKIYLFSDQDRIDKVVLPVRGKGLWSTMYAYVALDSDLSTIEGVSFYEHGETPGLGGEIANPRWQAGWQGKKLFGPNGEMELSVVKGGAQVSEEQKPYSIDGLSGATLTTQGVDNLMRFWFGEHGYEPFIARIKQEGGFNG
jgi:Na+-transporting NADH:ubiquinone oxidoreductase subunit C